MLSSAQSNGTGAVREPIRAVWPSAVRRSATLLPVLPVPPVTSTVRAAVAAVAAVAVAAVAAGCWLLFVFSFMGISQLRTPPRRHGPRAQPHVYASTAPFGHRAAVVRSGPERPDPSGYGVPSGGRTAVTTVASRSSS